MNRADFQFALREWWEQITSPFTLLIAGGASLILAMMGPFGTIDTLNIIERILYWIVMVFGTSAVGIFSSQIAFRVVGDRLVPRVFLSSILTGIGASIVVITLNIVVFYWIPNISELLILLATIFAISGIVSTVITVSLERLKPCTPLPSPAHVPLLSRLPLEKRAKLVALSVEDHYVRVATIKSEALLLMRLSDAIRETGSVRGEQVHRSHWVAFDQVVSATKRGDRAELTMSNKRVIPVSRANLPKIREAGLLPK